MKRVLLLIIFLILIVVYTPNFDIDDVVSLRLHLDNEQRVSLHQRIIYDVDNDFRLTKIDLKIVRILVSEKESNNQLKYLKHLNGW